MIGWTAVLAGCGACFAFKIVGYLTPTHWLETERVRRVAALVTIALLAALLAVQTFGSGSGPGLTVDARLPAVAVAAILLWRRAPFIVVVVAAAAVAAGLRALA